MPMSLQPDQKCYCPCVMDDQHWQLSAASHDLLAQDIGARHVLTHFMRWFKFYPLATTLVPETAIKSNVLYAEHIPIPRAGMSTQFTVSRSVLHIVQNGGYPIHSIACTLELGYFWDD